MEVEERAESINKQIAERTVLPPTRNIQQPGTFAVGQLDAFFKKMETGIGGITQHDLFTM